MSAEAKQVRLGPDLCPSTSICGCDLFAVIFFLRDRCGVVVYSVDLDGFMSQVVVALRASLSWRHSAAVFDVDVFPLFSCMI